MAGALVDRAPAVSRDRLVGELCRHRCSPTVRFDSYRPDPEEPSQSAALDALRGFADRLRQPPPRRRLRRRASPPPGAGVYLDGGFGVGKTHLLASLWHAAPPPAAYVTFVELTHLVGALGFAATVEALAEFRLLAIDEFEWTTRGTRCWCRPAGPADRARRRRRGHVEHCARGAGRGAVRG